MTITDQGFSDVPTPTGPMRTYVLRRMAALLAGHGYLVAVREIYHELEPAGTVLTYNTAGADSGNAHKAAKEISAYDGDSRAALDFLAQHEACTRDGVRTLPPSFAYLNWDL